MPETPGGPGAVDDGPGAAGPRSVAPVFNPWRRLRELDHVELRWVVVPGVLGATDGVRSIQLHPHQSQAQRRSTLAHELAHLELRHGPGCTEREEREAGALAARWLVSLDDLVEAARWARSWGELADELWVDVETVRIRLATLVDSEREELLRARGEEELP